MLRNKTLFALLLIMVTASCNFSGKNDQVKTAGAAPYKPGTYGYDLRFLQQHDSVIILKSGKDKAQVVVSPKYQAKVFTSTAEGNEGLSFGWVNYKAFTAPADAHMNAYGGENRFWLGPEGGRFSLFFKPGSSMVFDNWKTPPPIDTETWSVTAKSNTAVTMQKEMKLANYAGTQMELLVNRTVTILDSRQIGGMVGISADTGYKAVAYETVNVLTNSGAAAWTEVTGMPCMWLLDMFKPTPETVIIVPFENSGNEPLNKIATTNYFGEIPADRITSAANVLYFKADGKRRGKLGIVPGKAKPVAGSYDQQNNVLTIVMFTVEPEARYLNQEWNTTKPAFSGDAVNAYNDGPLPDGSQMGPFYEIESVSPAAFLKPGQSLTHKHTVCHFTGNEKSLDAIAKKLLGVTLAEIQQAF